MAWPPFSLRELAKVLGVYPTAIYWYVPNRNELIAGAVALALADVSRQLGTGGSWPAPAQDAESWAQAHGEEVAAIPTSDYPALSRHVGRLSDRAFMLRWSAARSNLWTAAARSGWRWCSKGRRPVRSPSPLPSAQRGRAGLRRSVVRYSVCSYRPMCAEVIAEPGWLLSSSTTGVY